MDGKNMDLPDRLSEGREDSIDRRGFLIRFASLSAAAALLGVTTGCEPSAVYGPAPADVYGPPPSEESTPEPEAVYGPPPD